MTLMAANNNAAKITNKTTKNISISFFSSQ
jgi:hypothetical protein